MRIVLDKTYVKYSIYMILTATIIFILYCILSNLGNILKAVVNALGVIFSVLSPLIIALVIAYIFHPLVSWIDSAISKYIKPLAAADDTDRHKHLRRILSVLITYLLIMLVLVLLIYFLYVMISDSLPRHLGLNSMIQAIGNYSHKYNEVFNKIDTSLKTAGLSANLKSKLLGLVQSIQSFISNAIPGMFSSLQGFGINLLNTLLGFVISFYLLKDVEYFKSFYQKCTELLFNRSHNKKMSDFLTEVNGLVSSFIRGQLLIALIVGVTSSVALALVGLDYAVLVGMTTGLFNVIPYFGPIFGSVIAIIVGLISGSPLKAFLAVVALIIVQELDSNIFSPKIIGKSVGLHPVFIILSMVIGGRFFGLLGILLAVPAAGIIKLIIVRYTDAYYGVADPAIPKEGDD